MYNNRLLHDLPPLPPIRKSSAKNYAVEAVEVTDTGFTVPGQLESAEDVVLRPKTTERRTNIGLSRQRSEASFETSSQSDRQRASKG